MQKLVRLIGCSFRSAMLGGWRDTPPRKIRPRVSAAGVFGGSLRGCLSPDFSRSEKWSSSEQPEYPSGAAAFRGGVSRHLPTLPDNPKNAHYDREPPKAL